MQVGSTRLDGEAALARAVRPFERPVEVEAGLRPEPGLESDDPIFASAVRSVGGVHWREVPPCQLAKALIAHAIGTIHVTGDGNVMLVSQGGF